MPVDPYGQYYSDPYYSDSGWGYDNSGYSPWWDLASQGISQAAQTAQIISAGYPPGSTVVYSPTTQYPGQPQPMPAPGVAPGSAPRAPTQGIQLSQTTLMLLVGGVLLFMLGGRRK